MRNMSFSVRPDKIYLYSPYGIGDSLMICAYSDAINKKYGYNTVYLFKKSHQYIAESYELTNYEIIDEKSIAQNAHCFSSTPQKGRICRFHPEFSDDSSNLEEFMHGEKSFKELYAQYFDVNIENFVEPKRIITKRCLEKIKNTPLDKIVLCAPEMNASSPHDRVPLCVFKKLIEEYKKEGYDVFVNARKKEVVNEFADYCIDVEISELIWIAQKCYKVISSRSGIVDILAFLDVNMEVLYPNEHFYELYNLLRTFGISNISEIIVERS